MLYFARAMKTGRSGYDAWIQRNYRVNEGATDEEIEDAVHYAKSSAGWSAYLNGLEVDYETFKDEVNRACEYVRMKKAA